MRKYGFANYSNPNGVTFMENVLEEKIELGLANLVHLDKNIMENQRNPIFTWQSVLFEIPGSLDLLFRHSTAFKRT